MGSIHLTTLKCPFLYFGGKQNLAKTITKLIPPHKTYVEPFAGGAAVFWDKKKVETEVLSDLDFDIINFYKCLKYYQAELLTMLHNIKFNKRTLKNAFNLLKFPFNPDNLNIMRAAVFWYAQNGSYNGIPGSVGDHLKALAKSEWITPKHQERLSGVHLYSSSAFDIIEAYDSENTLFYVDPPYFNATQVYHINFSVGDYKKLLYVLSRIRGKFILSGYPSHLLKNLTTLFKWNNEQRDMCLSSATGNGNLRRKIEEITWNF